jgi:hypothetical protein
MLPVNVRIARALSAAALLSLPGCKQVLDIPDDPKLVEVEKGPWSCLENPERAAEATSDAALVRVQACNFVSPKCAESVTGFTVDLCSKLDLSCDDPIQASLKEVNGAMEFAVPTGGVLGVGFDGYLRVTPPKAHCAETDVFGDVGPLLCGLLGASCDPSDPRDEDCLFSTFVPALFFFNPPIKLDVSTPIPIPLVPTAAAQTLAAAAGGNFNPATGIVWATALDCTGAPASEVSYKLDKHQDLVTQLYMENGVVSSTANHTDLSGVGGFIGVPTGFVVIEGFLDDGGEGARIGKVGVNVEPFTISYTNLTQSD